MRPQLIASQKNVKILLENGSIASSGKIPRYERQDLFYYDRISDTKPLKGSFFEVIDDKNPLTLLQSLIRSPQTI